MRQDQRRFEDLTGRYQDLELRYDAAQEVIREHEALTTRYAGLINDHDAAQSQLAQQRELTQAQAQELDNCKTALSRIRTVEDQASVDMEVLRSDKDASIDKLRGQLLQAEEQVKFVEAGLAKMKASAEATISQEQGKHQKQQEALQCRLNQAQSELQSKSEEAEDMRKFVEESVKSQQALWQSKYNDLETKAIESKAAVENATATINNLQKQCDAARAEIASLHADEEQRQRNEANQQSLESQLKESIERLRQERDAALTESVKITAGEKQQHQIVSSQAESITAPAALEPQEHSASPLIVPPKVSEQLTFGKQRRRADRNTNTIVTSANVHSRAERAPLQSDVSGAQMEVPLPSEAEPTHSRGTQAPSDWRLRKQVSNSQESDEMLDSYSIRQSLKPASKNHIQGAAKSSQDDVQQSQTGTSQVYVPRLDFSGNPIESSNGHSGAHDATPPSMQIAPLSTGFEIFEDSQDLANQSIFEDLVRADFTFRKPFPLPNSSSKRSTRTASDRSSEREVPSRGKVQTPDNNDKGLSNQSRNFSSTLQDAGSSPAFMAPHNTKAKRMYSGSTLSGAVERSASHRATLTSHRPSTPLLDPRVLAKSTGAKRQVKDDQQRAYEYPNKKRTSNAAFKAGDRSLGDDSFVARSSQSVSNLPRIENISEGRPQSQSQTSRMRSSGTSARATRSQTKKNKGR